MKLRRLATASLVWSLGATACGAPLTETPAVVGVSFPAGPLRDLPSQVPGLVREARSVEVELRTGRASLEALVTRPAMPGRFPLVILNHGSPRGGDAERAEMSPMTLSAQAIAFARHGYAVLTFMRRGYGRSDSRNVEWAGPCEDRDYARAGRVSGEEVVATLRAVSSEAWADATRTLLVGHSAGGFAVLAAAAERPPGVVGVISFAGGRGSDAPDHVCQEARLVSAFAELGKASRIPTLWLYADNDHFFSPEMARQFQAAYTSGGAVAELVPLPPFGDDGHTFFGHAPAATWWPLIAPFLAKLGLPTDIVVAATSAPLAPPPSLREAGRKAFAAYLASDRLEKAFAVSVAGWGESFGQRTRADAIREALAHCRERSPECGVYAIGDDYAPGITPPPAPPR